MLKKDSPLKEVLKLGEPCRRCGHCCSYGSGILVDEDLKNIAHFLGLNEEQFKEGYLEEIEKFNTKRLRLKLIKKGRPYGMCVFYDKEIGCRIHAVKPLQCRVNNCSEHGEELSVWFMLNYFVNRNDPESIRQFNAYLKSGGKTLPGGRLKDFVPDKERLKKILSYEKLK